LRPVRGKLALPPADFIAVSAHKLGGPAGVGALVVRCRDGWAPPSRGGGQEDGARGGTENLLGILGFAAAASALPTAGPPKRCASASGWRTAHASSAPSSMPRRRRACPTSPACTAPACPPPRSSWRWTWRA
jgi:hypothetical protein